MSPSLLLWFDVVVPTTGAVFLESIVKVCVAELLAELVAVTVTLYLPSSVAPEPVVEGAFVEASWSTVPLMTPVEESIVSPCGNPVAE